jgi:hypothetical protein
MNVLSSRLRSLVLATAVLALPLPALAASQQIAASSHLLWLKPDGTSSPAIRSRCGSKGPPTSWP